MLEHPRTLPADVGVGRAQDGDHVVVAEPVEAAHVGDEAQGGLRGAEVVRAQPERAALPAGQHAPPVVVVGGARDREVGGVEAQLLDARVGHDQRTGARAQAVGDDHRVEAAGGAVVELHVHAGAVVVQTGDPVAEHVLGARGGVVVEQAGELAAQDLQLGRGAAGVVGARGEAGERTAGVVDEVRAGLAGVAVADGVLQAHPADHLAADPAHVDVLALLAHVVEALDHGHVPARGREPRRERRTGDAGPGDQDAAAVHVSPSTDDRTAMRGPFPEPREPCGGPLDQRTTAVTRRTRRRCGAPVPGPGRGWPTRRPRPRP